MHNVFSYKKRNLTILNFFQRSKPVEMKVKKFENTLKIPGNVKVDV